MCVTFNDNWREVKKEIEVFKLVSLAGKSLFNPLKRKTIREESIKQRLKPHKRIHRIDLGCTRDYTKDKTMHDKEYYGFFCYPTLRDLCKSSHINTNYSYVDLKILVGIIPVGSKIINGSEESYYYLPTSFVNTINTNTLVPMFFMQPIQIHHLNNNR